MVSSPAMNTAPACSNQLCRTIQDFRIVRVEGRGLESATTDYRASGGTMVAQKVGGELEIVYRACAAGLSM